MTACGLLSLLSLLVLIFFGRKAGWDAAENKQEKEVLDDIRKANDARTDIERDPAAAERVRSDFTR